MQFLAQQQGRFLQVAHSWYARSRSRAEARRRQRRLRALDGEHLSDGGLGHPVSSAVAEAVISATTSKIGLDLLNIPATQLHRDDLVRNCTRCQKRAECRLWLADIEADREGYLEFCPNGQRFRALSDLTKSQ